MSSGPRVCSRRSPLLRARGERRVCSRRKGGSDGYAPGEKGGGTGMLQAKRGEGRVCPRPKPTRTACPRTGPCRGTSRGAGGPDTCRPRGGSVGTFGVNQRTSAPPRGRHEPARRAAAFGVNQRMEICASNRNMCAIVTFASCVLLPQQSTLLCGRQTCMRIEISWFLTRIKIQILKYAGL